MFYETFNKKDQKDLKTDTLMSIHKRGFDWLDKIKVSFFIKKKKIET